MKYQQGDKFISIGGNGQECVIIVCEANEKRPAAMYYAIDSIDMNGVSSYDEIGGFIFVGDQFLDECFPLDMINEE